MFPWSPPRPRAMAPRRATLTRGIALLDGATLRLDRKLVPLISWAILAFTWGPFAPFLCLLELLAVALHRFTHVLLTAWFQKAVEDARAVALSRDLLRPFAAVALATTLRVLAAARLGRVCRAFAAVLLGRGAVLRRSAASRHRARARQDLARRDASERELGLEMQTVGLRTAAAPLPRLSPASLACS